ncbi:MAG: Gfo/Idh/MocA family oxidoreductase [Phycisphaerales bacterium]|nr:Gfo/Idh/MocA family oxidoreductase [Phycisphaerales bacterium]
MALIGAGNFATATLIPAMKKCHDVSLVGICSAGGLSARSAAGRHGFAYCTSDYQELLNDERIHAVVIATRHDTHARFTVDALRAGKHVFVEKPLALTVEQLDEVIAAREAAGRIVMAGYNRRFSPLSIAVRDFFAQRTGPIEVLCRVNAGAIAGDSWYQDGEEGGWRIISEGCHFVDLIQFICGCAPAEVFADMVGGAIAGGQNDNCAVTLKMTDGSLGTLIYVANGDSHLEKERVEAFGQGRAAVIENWSIARLSTGGRIRKVKPSGTGKGHGLEMAEFVRAVRDGREPSLTFDDAVACTLATFATVRSLASKRSQQCHLERDASATAAAVGV